MGTFRCHKLNGNCWHPERDSLNEPVDVAEQCPKHKMPRGECSACSPCELCPVPLSTESADMLRRGMEDAAAGRVHQAIETFAGDIDLDSCASPTPAPPAVLSGIDLDDLSPTVTVNGHEVPVPFEVTTGTMDAFAIDASILDVVPPPEPPRPLVPRRRVVREPLAEEPAPAAAVRAAAEKLRERFER